MIAIGIDIGGTHTRAGAVDPSGRLIALRRWVTDRRAGSDALIAELIQALAAVRKGTSLPNARTQVIGLALPGLIDRERGVVIRSINLPLLEGRPMADELTRRAGCPVTLVTDADAATWAEYAAHTPRPRRFVHLRLGTGIACGVVIAGALQDLGACRTGHLDVLIVEDGADALGCRCGRRGCLETIASGYALTRRSEQAGHAYGLCGLQEAWQRGERQARGIIQQAAAGVSTALVKLVQQFRPEAISVGGGVLSRLPSLFEEATARFRAWQASGDCEGGISIEPSRLGDDAGVVGAALLAVHGQRGQPAFPSGAEPD